MCVVRGRCDVSDWFLPATCVLSHTRSGRWHSHLSTTRLRDTDRFWRTSDRRPRGVRTPCIAGAADKGKAWCAPPSAIARRERFGGRSLARLGRSRSARKVADQCRRVRALNRGFMTASEHRRGLPSTASDSPSAGRGEEVPDGIRPRPGSAASEHRAGSPRHASTVFADGQGMARSGSHRRIETHTPRQAADRRRAGEGDETGRGAACAIS